MYTVQPLRPHFGGIIRDIDFSKAELNAQLFAKIKEDMVQYRVLVFKGQHTMTPNQQIAISKGLGKIESTFYKHPRSPHPDIFRVSNREEEGCTGVGRTGWHVDGTFMKAPFTYQTMHFPSVSKGGNTAFVPLKELYESQTEEVKAKWDRLWMVTGRDSKAHPLVYQHPFRNDTTMLFHCGRPFCESWLEDNDDEPSNLRRPEKMLPPQGVQDELTRACERALKDGIGVEMEWEAGDFSINDNTGLAHYAVPGTQNDASRVGLRILHRTTMEGITVPKKADGRESLSLR
eukprot:GEMP01048820.1.p1 GENE.GEMP01048820.1~~GEMP01048820.1.p1  ORF type:complete len:289 (+),score=62.16 GEMP01048820.1:331-1197(+)